MINKHKVYDEIGAARQERVARDLRSKTDPNHYKTGPFEVINFILKFNMGFCLGNATKYLFRAGKKKGEMANVDLNKALKYLEFAQEDMYIRQWQPSYGGVHKEYFDSYVENFNLDEKRTQILYNICRIEATGTVATAIKLLEEVIENGSQNT